MSAGDYNIAFFWIMNATSCSVFQLTMVLYIYPTVWQIHVVSYVTAVGAPTLMLTTNQLYGLRVQCMQVYRVSMWQQSIHINSKTLLTHPINWSCCCHTYWLSLYELIVIILSILGNEVVMETSILFLTANTSLAWLLSMLSKVHIAHTTLAPVVIVEL